jgi:hypothetical protein
MHDEFCSIFYYYYIHLLDFVLFVKLLLQYTERERERINSVLHLSKWKRWREWIKLKIPCVCSAVPWKNKIKVHFQRIILLCSLLHEIIGSFRKFVRIILYQHSEINLFCNIETMLMLLTEKSTKNNEHFFKIHF